MNKVFSFFKQPLVISITAAVILLFLFLNQIKQTERARFELAVEKHNVSALQDSIRITLDKNGKEEANKYAFLVDEVADLKQYNKELFDEVKAIKGNVNTIIKTDLKVVHDTVQVASSGQVIDSNVLVNFNYDTLFSPGNYRKLSGFTRFNLQSSQSFAQKNVDEFGVGLTVGIKNLDKGKPEIFAKSSYPGLTITQLEGAEIDPSLFKKKRKATIVASVGVHYTPVTYSFDNKKIRFDSQQIGVGLQLGYNLGKIFER